ncbi:winged helix-turn-helix domain-containing protein [Serratia marcescens]|nr:transcriptional regulator CadC [Serratia marcescens]HAT5021627.1 transcriptional regulator CadC [Serratia marcescens]
MLTEINKGILYNENENTLTHIDNIENKIILLKPASRLLSLFIKNNRKLLLREQLLNDVWVDHGLKASNNNLNNYVSGLRKSLAQLGAEEIIVTYPRQGFKFNAESIREVDKPSGEYNNAADRKAKTPPALPPIKMGVGIQRRLQRWIMLIAICLALFFAIELYQRGTQANMHLLGKYELCQIYSVNSRSDALPKIKQRIQHAGFNCQSSTDVYYYDSIRDETAQKDQALLTFCPREPKKPCTYNYIDKA